MRDEEGKSGGEGGETEEVGGAFKKNERLEHEEDITLSSQVFIINIELKKNTIMIFDSPSLVMLFHLSLYV